MSKKKTRTSGGTGGLATRDRPGSSGGGSLTRDQRGPERVGNKDQQQQRLVSSPSSLSHEEGAYSNQRLTYICTSLIGSNISVETEEGDIHEGVFRCFSPNLDITLDQVHTVDPDDPTCIDPTTVKSTMVIDLKHIVRCMAVDVDLNAAKMEQETFMTDMQISGTKMNGEMRNLVAWEADGGEHDVSLDLGGASESDGWRAEDMFKANEDQYGVTSSFKDNLEGYTLQLSTDRDSDKYRELEAKAAAAARQIEGSSTNKLAIELENGEEEEAAFSAVQRSGSNNRGERDGDASKYVPPGRRPPPAASGSSNNRSTPPQQMQRQQQSSPASMSRGGGQQADNPNDRPRGRRDFQQGTSPASSTHSGRDQHFQRDDYARAGGVGRGRGGGGQGGGSGNNGPAYVKQQDGPRQQGGPGGGGPGPGKSRNEQTSELRQFKDNFHLTSTAQDQSRYYDQKQPSPKLASPPSVSAQQGQAPQQPGNQVQHSRPQQPPQQYVDRSKQGPGGTSPPITTASDVRRTSPPTASIIARQESIEQRTPTPVKTPPITTPVGGPQGMSPAGMQPTGPAPVSVGAPASTIAAKSTLNPNAGAFVLNPKAEEFQPQAAARPPVGQTPPPPRPITPATPTGGNLPIQVGQVGYYPTIQAGGFNPYMGTMPNVSAASNYIYAPTSQPPPPHQYQQQPRFRAAAPHTSNAGGPGREQNQVLAATGQPLLSPQNNFALIPPTMAHMPPQVQQQAAQAVAHQQQQQMMSHGGNMVQVPVSGGPPVMVRPMEGATSLPAAWSLQPNQPPPQMGGPQHPPPSGTPTSANHHPLPSATPPNSGQVVQQPPSGAPQNHPQANPGGHGQPQMAQMAQNGQPGGVGQHQHQHAAAGMYNFIPGSMQHQSLPHQFYPQLLLQHGQTPLLQQPLQLQQGQQIPTSMASGIQQFPYGAVPHSHHGVVPGQQSSPQFIIAPHGMHMPVAGSQVAPGGQGSAQAAAAAQAAAQAAQAAQNQMQGHGPPSGPGGPQWGGYFVEEESLHSQQLYPTMSPYHPQYPVPIYFYHPVPPSQTSQNKPHMPSPLLGDNVISTNNPYSSNKSQNPENIRSSDSSASNLTPGDKETLQSDSFHSEEKPVLLKSNVAEQSSAQNVVNMNMKSTSGGSPPRSLMTPSVSGPRNGGISHGGTSQHQNQRKVSTSSSVTSSPKRARIMNVNNNAAAHASGGTGKASAAPTTQPTHFKNKTWVSPATVPTSQATPTSPTSVTTALSASVMDICNPKPSKPNHRGGGLQHQQRPPRTFYGSQHFTAINAGEGQTVASNAHGGQRGRYQHGYAPRGGYHRHGGGGQFSQMSTADVNRRQRPNQP